MIFKPQLILRRLWLHDGTLEDAITWRARIDEAHDVGYVYLLGYDNGRTKVGATSYFPERLGSHHGEMKRLGITVTRCVVTRPIFNYMQLEKSVKRRFEPTQHFGEVFDAPIGDLVNFIACQPLMTVAPEGYGQSRCVAHRFLMKLMTDISEGLGIPVAEGVQRYVQTILDRHTALGRATGLSERDATHNALAVIEAHTGLNLSVFHDVLREVA
jgi:hypothetical protein